jgi:hypothetical protein
MSKIEPRGEGGGADFCVVTGSQVPNKPKNLVLGYDRPMSILKFIFFRTITLKPLVAIYAWAQKILKKLLDFENDKKQHLSSLKELQEMNCDTSIPDSNEFGYTGDTFTRELDFIHKYALQTRNFHLMNNLSESKVLYERAVADLSAIIEKNNIKNVFNFGIGFAFVDKQLALKFPNVNFFGIERTLAAKFYNEADGIPSNLKIFAGDVISHLENNVYENGLFIHIRTAVLLPKSFIENLYNRLENSGFIGLYAVEQLGLSRNTGKAYKFSLLEKKSELFRRHMFIHNYPGILKKHNFDINSLDLLHTNHPHFDYRMLVINASKKLS